MKLYVSNGKVLVWNFADVFELRKRHRIVGSYIGCFYHQTFQHQESSLPVLLLPEEATLLQDKDIAELVFNSRIGQKPDTLESERYKKLRKELLEQQIIIFEKNAEKRKLLGEIHTETERYFKMNTMKPPRDKTATKRNSDGTLAIEPSQKKILLQENLPLPSIGGISDPKQCSTSAAPDCVSFPEDTGVKSDEVFPDITDKEMQMVLSETPQDLSINSSKVCDGISKELYSEQDSSNSKEENRTDSELLICEKNGCSPFQENMEYKGQLPDNCVTDKKREITSSKKYKFCKVQQFTECPWKDKSKDVVAQWNFPSTEKEKLRYAVFRDLWEKGFYLTPGTKFGGDFLVYPGDPELYHSMFIVFCVSQVQKFSAVDLIVLGRMGNQVNKTLVLASCTEGSMVDYISLSWNCGIV